MEEVIINHSSFGILGPLRFFIVFDSHCKVAESFVHIELLNHRVHVANIAEIFESSIASSWTLINLSWIYNFHIFEFVVYRL